MGTSTSRPPRDSQLLYSAIFFLFAPIGLLLVMVQNPPPGFLTALLSAIFTGVISASWAFTFIRRRWWIIAPLVIGPMILPGAVLTLSARTGFVDLGTDLAPTIRLIVMAIMCVIFTAVGFILSVIHQRRNERRTARALAELDLAAEVHLALVPPIELTTALGIVHGRSIASSTMGGDLIEAFDGPDRLDVILGDVSGHGVSAGVVMAMLKSCIHMRRLQSSTLGEIVADTNRVLTDLISPNMFATFAAIRLRPHHSLEYALAGHLPIFHYRANQNTWTQHSNQNLPLGIDRSEAFLTGSTTTSGGDIIVLLTDGLMEVQDGTGKELGLARLAAVLQSSLNPNLPAMHASIMTAINSYGPQLDDQSLVLIRVT